MRRMSRLGLVAAMESEEEVKKTEEIKPVVPVVTEPVIGDNAESVETELIEVNEAEAEAEATDEQVEEAVEVAEALESIADAMRISAANGGMDKYSAAAVSVAVDHMYRRVGITTKAMPALESFGGTSSRISATTLAMEEIKEQAKKVWAAIIAAFEKAIQWAKDFYIKVITSWEKTEKRATELAAKAKDAKGEGKVENSGVIEKLVVEGKAPDLDKGLENFKKFIESTLGHAEKSVEFYSKISKAVDESSTEEAIAGKFVAPPLAVEGLKETSEGTAKAGLANFVSEEQFGGVVLVASLPKEELKGKEGAEAAAGISFKLDKKAGQVADKELPALNAEAAAKVVAVVGEVAKAGLAFKAALGKIEEQKKAIIAISKKLAGKEDTAVAARSVINSLARNIDQPGASVNVYGLRTAKAPLDYVELSIKAGAVKAEEKKSEEQKPE